MMMRPQFFTKNYTVVQPNGVLNTGVTASDDGLELNSSFVGSKFFANV